MPREGTPVDSGVAGRLLPTFAELGVVLAAVALGAAAGGIAAAERAWEAEPDVAPLERLRELELLRMALY